MPKELQLTILGDFRGLPQQVVGTELDQFGKLIQEGRVLHRFRIGDYRIYFERHGVGGFGASYFEQEHAQRFLCFVPG